MRLESSTTSSNTHQDIIISSRYTALSFRDSISENTSVVLVSSNELVMARFEVGAWWSSDAFSVCEDEGGWKGYGEEEGGD